MLSPAPWGWEERSWAPTPSQSAVLHERRGTQHPCHYRMSPPSAQKPNCEGICLTPNFLFPQPFRCSLPNGEKQAKREICVPRNSHSQKWCFAKTPWQPSSPTTRDLIFMRLSNAHQSLIFCFGTTTWVLLPHPALLSS